MIWQRLARWLKNSVTSWGDFLTIWVTVFIHLGDYLGKTSPKFVIFWATFDMASLFDTSATVTEMWDIFCTNNLVTLLYIKENSQWVTVAKWICLCLLSCGLGFESQAHSPCCFFVEQFIENTNFLQNCKIILTLVLASVIRFGEISPLWQHFMNLCQMFVSLFRVWQFFELTL